MFLSTSLFSPFYYFGFASVSLMYCKTTLQCSWEGKNWKVVVTWGRFSKKNSKWSYGFNYTGTVLSSCRKGQYFRGMQFLMYACFQMSVIFCLHWHRWQEASTSENTSTSIPTVSKLSFLTFQNTCNCSKKAKWGLICYIYYIMIRVYKYDSYFVAFLHLAKDF